MQLIASDPLVGFSRLWQLGRFLESPGPQSMVKVWKPVIVAFLYLKLFVLIIGNFICLICNKIYVTFSTSNSFYIPPTCLLQIPCLSFSLSFNKLLSLISATSMYTGMGLCTRTYESYQLTIFSKEKDSLCLRNYWPSIAPQ